jgi:hypothetical protein
LGEIPAEAVRRRFGVGGHREDERERNNRREVLSLVLWSKHDSTEGRERERRREWSRIWAQDRERRRRTSSVSWRTLGSDGLAWQREEGTARLARRWGKGWNDTWVGAQNVGRGSCTGGGAEGSAGKTEQSRCPGRKKRRKKRLRVHM